MKTRKADLSPFDLENGFWAEFKHTTSRGRDTYGYNICTLYINRQKVSSTCGGGYDMQGTALGDWMEVQFQDQLQTLTARTPSNERGFYGLRFSFGNEAYGSRAKYRKGAIVHLDGGTGIDCMIRILEAIGFSWRYAPTMSNKTRVYFVAPIKKG